MSFQILFNYLKTNDLYQEHYGYAVSSAIYFYLQKSSLPCHSEERSDEESMTTNILIIIMLLIRDPSLRFAPFRMTMD